MEDFADSICYILQDARCASIMGIEARRLIETDFEYQSIGERLEKIYRDVVNQ